MRTASYFRTGLAGVLLGIFVSSQAANTIGYDPSADPFALLEAAKGEATADNKLILVVAGGEWCIWCHYLNAFLAGNEDVSHALKDRFVVAKIYYGDETDNDAFFATLPAAVGYPHFWIVAADGNVLESQNTLPLEDGGKSYDKAAFLAFIDRWQVR